MTAPDASSGSVKPLTKRTAEGEPYIRRADAELQIEKALTLGEEQILQMLGAKRRREEADYLLDETIVYLLREARAANREHLLGRLYEELNLRIWKLLAKFRANFKNNPADFEDFGQKVGLAVFRKIIDINLNAGDFAQVQFGSFVVSEARAAFNQTLVTIRREQAMFETGRESEADEENEQASDTVWIKELRTDRKISIREAMRKLSEEQQIVAAMLADGFQVESIDPNEMTISRHLGVSSRTIRNWIGEMRRKLAGYEGEAKHE